MTPVLYQIEDTRIQAQEYIVTLTAPEKDKLQHGEMNRVGGNKPPT